MNDRRWLRQCETLWTLATSRGPVYLILYLTARCNFRCPMCFYLEEIKNPNKEEIDLSRIERIARGLGRLIQLSLTGGEPFLRGDIAEVVETFVRHNRVRYVTIPTNGSLPERICGTVEQLVARHPEVHFRIPVSLDGFPADHDAIRGARSFDRIVETMSGLCSLRDRRSNVTVDINTCYSALNRGKVAHLPEFVAERFRADNHTVTYVRGHADKRTKDASVDEYDDLVEGIRRIQHRGESRPFSGLLRAVMDLQREIISRTLRRDREYVPCQAGRKLIVINERGEVHPCEILGRRMGTLTDHHDDVGELLGSPPARELVHWIRRTHCHCTFECALATSIIFHPPSYPRVLWRTLRAWWARSNSTGNPTLINHGNAPSMSLPIL